MDGNVKENINKNQNAGETPDSINYNGETITYKEYKMIKRKKDTHKE